MRWQVCPTSQQGNYVRLRTPYPYTYLAGAWMGRQAVNVEHVLRRIALAGVCPLIRFRQLALPAGILAFTVNPVVRISSPQMLKQWRVETYLSPSLRLTVDEAKHMLL